MSAQQEQQQQQRAGARSSSSSHASSSVEDGAAGGESWTNYDEPLSDGSSSHTMTSYYTDSEDEDDPDGIKAKRRRSFSACRAAVKKLGKARTEKGRQLQILMGRGAFEGLPIGKHNDMVTGSWWFVWGSLVSALIPIVPLVDIYYPIFTIVSDTNLKAFDEMSTWVFLIISGLGFTFGSYAFVRAFEHPPRKPMFDGWYHLQTDELLGAWLYLLAVMPAVPFSAIYLQYNPTRITYWGSFMCSILIVLGSAGFVYTAYPHPGDSQGHSAAKPSTAIVAPFFRRLCGDNSWVIKHVQNDWLASCWFFFWASVLVCFGSWVLLLGAANDRQLFVWITGLIDSIIFLVGSAYFCSGSYPPPVELKNTDHDDVAKTLTEDVSNVNVSEIRPKYEFGGAAGARSPRKKKKQAGAHGARGKSVTFDNVVDVRIITPQKDTGGFARLEASVENPLHAPAPTTTSASASASTAEDLMPPPFIAAPALATPPSTRETDSSSSEPDNSSEKGVRRSSLSLVPADFVASLAAKQTSDANAYIAKHKPSPPAPQQLQPTAAEVRASPTKLVPPSNPGAYVGVTDDYDPFGDDDDSCETGAHLVETSR